MAKSIALNVRTGDFTPCRWMLSFRLSCNLCSFLSRLLCVNRQGHKWSLSSGQGGQFSPKACFQRCLELHWSSHNSFHLMSWFSHCSTSSPTCFRVHWKTNYKKNTKVVRNRPRNERSLTYLCLVVLQGLSEGLWTLIKSLKQGSILKKSRI